MDAMKLNEVVELVTRQGETLQARRLRPADRQALRRLGESLSPTTTGVFLPHHYDDATLEPILRRSEAGDDLTLGVFRGSRIVGYFFLWYLDQAFPLLGIGLHDDYQGAGLGRQMMNLLVAEAARLGRDGIDLTTLPTNDRAFRLYQSVGFRQIQYAPQHDSKLLARKLFIGFKPPRRAEHYPRLAYRGNRGRIPRAGRYVRKLRFRSRDKLKKAREHLRKLRPGYTILRLEISAASEHQVKP